MKKKIILRADGSSDIGMGHIMRCVAVFQMLRIDFDLSIAVYNPDESVKKLFIHYKIPLVELKSQSETNFIIEFDATILDGYWFDNNYIQKINAQNKKVIQIDDLAGNEFFADVIINHAINADYSHSVLHNCKHLLIGPEYVLIREEFLKTKQHTNSFEGIKTVTLNMGGSDPHNYTFKVLKALLNLNHKFSQINIIIGDAYSHSDSLSQLIATNNHNNISILKALSDKEMIYLFENTSLLLCPASTIVYEASAIGVPIGCFLSADNQINIYNGLKSKNCVIALGNLAIMNDWQLNDSLIQLISNYNLAVNCITNQHELIDKKSSQRIREAILSLWS